MKIIAAPHNFNAAKINPSIVNASNISLERIPKSDSVHFGNKQQKFNRKIEDFASILDKQLAEKNVDMKSLEASARVIMGPNSKPILNIKPFSEMYGNITLGDRTAAYLYVNIIFNFNDNQESPANVNFSERTMFVKPPENYTEYEKIQFADAMTHEFTHALQHDVPEKSTLALINRYIEDKPFTDDVLKTLQAAPMIFKGIDNDLAKIFSQVVKKQNNNPQPVRDASLAALRQKMKFSINMQPEEVVSQLIDGHTQFACQRFGKIDKQFILDYISLLANNEKEAHSNGMDMAKKMLDIHSPVDTEWRLVLFDKLKEAACSMK